MKRFCQYFISLKILPVFFSTATPTGFIAILNENSWFFPTFWNIDVLENQSWLLAYIINWLCDSAKKTPSPPPLLCITICMLTRITLGFHRDDKISVRMGNNMAICLFRGGSLFWFTEHRNNLWDHNVSKYFIKQKLYNLLVTFPTPPPRPLPWISAYAFFEPLRST